VDDLTRDLKAHALDLGFDLVGVAPAGPSESAAAVHRWLDAGMCGDMAYMARTRDVRSDPRNLLAGCRSVVAVAMSYRTDHPLSISDFSDDVPRVWVSRYAWGHDYHRILKKRLVRLGKWLAHRRPGAGWRACVDTAPVLEREWAARAGLGWIGKNTSLLNRQLGSELFLGLLLTDLDLDTDSPATDHCGRCAACIDACPTQAFVEPRILDARRCVGYLTIEHRSPISNELHQGFGSMVAGCDVCQEVCPWTARAPINLHPEFQPAPQRYRPRLETLLGFDETAFREWRTGSPLTRIPYAQFQRTLEIVGRNQGRVGLGPP